VEYVNEIVANIEIREDYVPLRSEHLVRSGLTM